MSSVVCGLSTASVTAHNRVIITQALAVTWGALLQCFSTAGLRHGTRPCHQLYGATRG